METKTTITPIILNYNLPEEADNIYTKLVKDGFEQIIVVDNGSDKQPVPHSVNFRLPRNIRYTGQARMVLIYCMDYFPSEYYWLITTSTELLPEVNYMKCIHEAISDMRNFKHSLISPSFDQDLPDKYHFHSTPLNQGRKYGIAHPMLTQNIAALLPHDILSLCREQQAAFFNLDLYRGHGIMAEYNYCAVKRGYFPVIAYDMPVRWVMNPTHEKKVDVESKEMYLDQAAIEFHKSFAKRYGQFWRSTFVQTFLKQQRKIKPEAVAPYKSPFPFEFEELTKRKQIMDVLRSNMRNITWLRKMVLFMKGARHG